MQTDSYLRLRAAYICPLTLKQAGKESEPLHLTDLTVESHLLGIMLVVGRMADQANRFVLLRLGMIIGIG